MKKILEVFRTYPFAFRVYVKADSATLYGFTENGDCDINAIMKD